jgi:flagellar hook-basal body complex protein FliE
MPDPLIQAIANSAEFRIDPLTTGATTPASTSPTGFGNALAGAVENLAQTQAAADGQAQALALGKTTDIAGVTMGIERANLAMQLAVQVRNKAVDAYHEIFRMQI